MFMPVVLAVASASTRDLVFDARYYFQGKRKSYHQIYLCRHDGTNRIQITNNEFDSSAPMWIDQGHIAYIEHYKRVPSNKPGEDPTVLNRVMLYDVYRGRKKKLGEIDSHDDLRGVWPDGNTINAWKSGPNNTVTSIRYKISLTGITKLPAKGDDPYIKDLQDDARGLTSWEHQEGKWALYWTKTDPNTGGETDADVAKCSINLKSEFKDKSKNFKLQGNRLMKVMVAKDGTGIIVTSFAYSKYRADHFVYKFTHEYQRCELVADKIGEVEIHAKNPLWLAGQLGRKELGMAKLNDGRSVYVNWLFAGNWRRGVQWTVATGLVDVGSSQLWP
jgi:hypothetical protein